MVPMVLNPKKAHRPNPARTAYWLSHKTNVIHGHTLSLSLTDTVSGSQPSTSHQNEEEQAVRALQAKPIFLPVWCFCYILFFGLIIDKLCRD